MGKNVTKPCKDCPFMAWTEPGALGGSAPEVYMGQIFGPFVLPCHKACDFDDPQWREKSINTPQCAGAAMFRKSMGISDYLPDVIHSLEPDGPVLDSPVKFYAHHKQISEEEALAQLRAMPPQELLRIQMMRQSTIHFDLPHTKENAS